MGIATTLTRFRDYVFGPSLNEGGVHTKQCQFCGNMRQTKYVTFYRNVGMLFSRQTHEIQGNMCKSCVHKYFWQFTQMNLVLGWWGAISFLVTPIYLVQNLANYLIATYQLRGNLD